jgi:hypothetical protein
MDATLITARSDKEGAAPTYKKGFGFHPLGAWLASTAGSLAMLLRPGNAGSSTVADHLQVLASALAQIPARWRSKRRWLLAVALPRLLAHPDTDHVRERQDPPVSPAVSHGLLLAWAIHDLEEVLAFEHWKRAAIPRLRARFPRVPGLVWQQLESATVQDFALAVAIVGVLMATASAAGQASGGRSRYFQLMLTGFGLHTIGHVASAVAARGYTPGVVTAPLVAAPFTAWARRQLKAADTWEKLSARDIVPGTALALAVLVGSHTLARALHRSQPHST